MRLFFPSLRSNVVIGHLLSADAPDFDVFRPDQGAL